MRTKTTAALVTATAALALSGAPAAHAIPGPPLDPVAVSMGGGCPDPDNPCDPTGPEVRPDPTYPKRLAAWVYEYILP